jgi:hypothetical protein
MTTPAWDNLDSFLNTDDFAVDATLDGVPVTGVFYDSYFEAFDNEPGVSTSLPRFWLKAEDAIDPVGKELIVEAISYTVVETQPDGNGFSLLVLNG